MTIGSCNLIFRMKTAVPTVPLAAKWPGMPNSSDRSLKDGRLVQLGNWVMLFQVEHLRQPMRTIIAIKELLGLHQTIYLEMKIRCLSVMESVILHGVV